jgi:excisionase family DNA binding protein
MKYRERDDPDLARATEAFSDLAIALGRYLSRQIEEARQAASAKSAHTVPERRDRRPEPEPLPLAYGIADAAKTLGVSKGTVWRRIKGGQIRTVKLGARTLIRAEELRALLAPPPQQH